MALSKKEIKDKVLSMVELLAWHNIGKFRGSTLYLTDVKKEGVCTWGYLTIDGRQVWSQIPVAWKDLTDDEYTMLEKFVILKFPKSYTVKRNSYLIEFTNEGTGETMAVNLKDKKFTKRYATGKERDIKYPGSFFKGMDGRAVATTIPADDNFKKLVDVIIRKESACSNFGTFLIRLFDNIHLETYISANVEFDYMIRVPYNFFDKDVRDVLNKHKMKYNQTVESFFANNHDLGKSMMYFIKDEPDFPSRFRSLATNMRDINVLVDTYNYDVKALFTYCKERNWTSGANRWASSDLVSYLCDYARMADLVFPNGFDKYPKDIVDHHDGVTKLYQKEKVKFDDKLFEKVREPKLEYEGKEFCIVYPASTAEIQAEGRILSHCVGSYVQAVINRQKHIVFLRTKEAKADPLVTVEIRDNRVAQARGKYNRALSYEEKLFLKEYAEKRKLSYTSA